MKQYLLIFAVLLPYMVVGQPSRKPAQGEQPSQPIRVTLKYDRPIGGYKVTAIWQPFEASCETGRIVVTFRHITTGAEFQYINNEKFSSYHTDCIIRSDGFEGWKNGDSYTIEYTSPDAMQNVRLPLDGYLPFQFYDVDFDGAEELLVLDWGGSKFGDFCVYEIVGKGLRTKSYPPFDSFNGYTQFDKDKQTIRQCIIDGAWSEAAVTYRKRPSKTVQSITIPAEFDQSLKETLATMASSVASDFQIVSARIRLGEQVYKLSVRDNSWSFD